MTSRNKPPGEIFFLSGTNRHAKEICHHHLQTSGCYGFSLTTETSKKLSNLTKVIPISKQSHCFSYTELNLVNNIFLKKDNKLASDISTSLISLIMGRASIREAAYSKHRKGI